MCIYIYIYVYEIHYNRYIMNTSYLYMVGLFLSADHERRGAAEQQAACLRAKDGCLHTLSNPRAPPPLTYKKKN